jgi:Protein of unknown function, DUF481
MRILSFCFLLMLLTSASYAGSNDTTTVVHKKRKMEHDININTTFFIKQIINLSGTSLAISPYIIGYKFFPVKNHGLRFSIGGNYSSQTQNPDSNFVQRTKSSELDYRIGYEYRHFFGKRWVFFTGVDMVNSFTSINSKVNSSTDIVTTSTSGWSLGGGPVAGIQVNISKSISLFLETAFYYAYSSSRSKTSSLNFPEENVNKLTSYGQSAQFVLPTSLFFEFRFQ